MVIVGDVGVIAVAVIIAGHRSDIVIIRGASIVVEVIVVLVGTAVVGDGVVVGLTRLPPTVYVILHMKAMCVYGGAGTVASRRHNRW